MLYLHDEFILLQPEAEAKPSIVSSGAGWRPIFVSLGDLDRPTTSTLHRASEHVDAGDSLSILGKFFVSSNVLNYGVAERRYLSSAISLYLSTCLSSVAAS